jgi:hypothetical protein
MTPCAARKIISSMALSVTGPRLYLDAVGVEHVADARSDDPLDLAPRCSCAVVIRDVANGHHGCV